MIRSGNFFVSVPVSNRSVLVWTEWYVFYLASHVVTKKGKLVLFKRKKHLTVEHGV